MTTAVVEKKGKAAKTAKKADVPAGFRLLRGKLVPIGIRRPVTVRIASLEEKLAKLDDKYATDRQKIEEHIEKLRSSGFKAVQRAEIETDAAALVAEKGVDAAAAELAEQLKILRAKFKAVKAKSTDE
mgnify:CR=1 FL=1